MPFYHKNHWKLSFEKYEINYEAFKASEYLLLKYSETWTAQKVTVAEKTYLYTTELYLLRSNYIIN